ncbi:hypothetical protein MKX03_008959, partial [Papaver bracteatum]
CLLWECWVSNSLGLEAAVNAAAEFLNKAVKPVMVEGPKLRVAKACIVVMSSAKGLMKETHPHFIGTYWGTVSMAFCAEIKEKAIIVQPDRVVTANEPAFGCVLMKKFLPALAKKLQQNTTAYENYHRIYVTQKSDNVVIAETGDNDVIAIRKLKLPEGCGYEFQMRYGSIGWSIGATLGYAQAAKDNRVIACICDGSFQVTAQDISTMLRCEKNTIFFLINNEMVEAIETETEVKKDCLCFIDIVVHKDDTSKELLEWGSWVSSANSRLPNHQ